MNDVEDLRDAMHSTPDFEPRPLDLAVVMAAGGRLRRRRRLAVGAASGFAVLALLVGGAQFVRSGPADGGTPVAAASDPVVSDPTATAARANDTLGDVISTGLRDDSAERVLYVVSVDLPELPEVQFGIVAGRRLPGGSLTNDVLANETEGSARAAGFHAAQAGMNVNGVRTLTFGYYSGAAARITVLADGKPVDAHHAAWSEDPSIIIFWFDPEQVTPDMTLKSLTAYDSNGRTLPAGDNRFGIG